MTLMTLLFYFTFCSILKIHLHFRLFVGNGWKLFFNIFCQIC